MKPLYYAVLLSASLACPQALGQAAKPAAPAAKSSAAKSADRKDRTVEEPAALVEAVQMPAWLERNEGGRPVRRPLSPGVELRQGDQVRTGAGSRLLVKLSEGSLVKLGENGTLRIGELKPSEELFKGVLSVLEGAFRFTTQKIGASRRRDININVAQVTAGIRGTDLWGKSVPNREIVCLIEGRIEVAAPNDPPVVMNEPRQFYRRESGTAQPVSFVDPVQLGEWAKETEIESGRGAARRGGRWKIDLITADSQNTALRVYDEVRTAGYAAEIYPTPSEGKLVYIVRIRSLPSRAEADALAGQLRGRYGVTDPKVGS